MDSEYYINRPLNPTPKVYQKQNKVLSGRLQI